MGTRSLIGAIKGGEWKIAQYNQWDGYPTGQGLTVLNFLRAADLEEFVQKLDLCRLGTDEEIEAAYAAYSTNGGMSMEQSDAFKKSPFWYLSRDTGADILNVVLSADSEIICKDSSSFGGEGLFCEWAYVIDADRRVLEVYKGFFQTPAPEGERFAIFNAATVEKAEADRERALARGYSSIGTYYPVHLIKEYSFDALPDEQQFIADLEEPDEEDEDEDEDDVEAEAEA